MLTGEPDAGDPHVRFGGRGGAIQCVVPTPIIGSKDCQEPKVYDPAVVDVHRPLYATA